MKYKECERIWHTKCARFYKVNFDVEVNGTDISVTAINDFCPRCKEQLDTTRISSVLLRKYSRNIEENKTKAQETLLLEIKDMESILNKKFPEDEDLKAAFKYIKARACGE
jgi:hypothetical protein